MNAAANPNHNHHGRQQGQGYRYQYVLSAEALLSYLLGTDERIETMVTCRRPDILLLAADDALYEALGSVDQNKDGVLWTKAVKLLEQVRIVPSQHQDGERRILTYERVGQLRKLAGKKSEDNEGGDDKNG